MKEKELKIHEISQKIIKILIESELSITFQLEVLKKVKQRLEFCRNTGAEIKQQSLDL